MAERLMEGLIVLIFFSGFLIGWGVSSKMNHAVLKRQNKYLKERVRVLRTIWLYLNKPIPNGVNK